jgi:hypothetical protein
MGYRWKVGDGVRVRFWEDLWLGSSSLAIHYWELYCLVNEQNTSIAELWDGENLKCTFRRYVDVRLLSMWYEVVDIASTLELSKDEDELIWQFHSSGVYSSQSLYAVINFRGVTPVFVPAVWSLKVPPRVFVLFRAGDCSSPLFWLCSCIIDLENSSWLFNWL